jgi:hypothetical protein
MGKKLPIIKIKFGDSLQIQTAEMHNILNYDKRNFKNKVPRTLSGSISRRSFTREKKNQSKNRS